MNKLRIFGDTCSVEKFGLGNKNLELFTAKENEVQTIYTFKELKDRSIKVDIQMGSIIMGFYNTATRKTQIR